MAEKLLEVRDLKKHFELSSANMSERSAVLKAVDGVTFDVYRGEVLGIVGESGCGKSTLGKTLLRLYERTSGTVTFQGQDIFRLPRKDLKSLRGRMQMIFQDPFSSLNPRKKVRSLIGQPLRIHGGRTRSEIHETVSRLMGEVGLGPEYGNRYPHQFSGGQRQRIGIARALALNPEFIVCDEAVSALDVSIQAQILNLLLDIQERHQLTYIFIAHDLSVVEFIATRIIVMYLGKIVEFTTKEQLSEERMHPYTQALFAAYPDPDPERRSERKRVVMGDVPSPIHPPGGCHFHPRCPFAMNRCRSEYPELRELKTGHFVACHLYQ